MQKNFEISKADLQIITNPGTKVITDLKKISLAILLWAPPFFAQTQNRISLSQCVQIAEKNSFYLQAKSQQIEAAKSVFLQNHSTYFPEFSIEGTHDQYFYNQYTYRAQSIGLAADWQLGNVLFGSAASYELEVSSVEADYESVRLSITRRVGMLYISILQNEFKQEQLQNQLDLLDDHLKISEALWQAGIRPKLDMLQSQSARYQVTEDMLKLQSEQENIRQELENLLNWKERTPFKPIPFRDLPIGTDTRALSGEDELAALDQNPLVKMLELQARAEKLRSREINATLLPNFHLFGGYIADADPTSFGNYRLFSMGLHIPLLHWGRSKFQREEVFANARSLEFEESGLLRELKIELDGIKTQYHQLLRVLSIQKAKVEISQQAFEMASANYEAGIITNLEFLAAQKTLSDYEIGIQETQLEIFLDLIHLYILTNQPDKIAELQGE